MSSPAELWTKALAFDAQHGEDGPEVLLALLARYRQAGEIQEADELYGMGQLLEQYHRAGSKKAN